MSDEILRAYNVYVEPPSNTGLYNLSFSLFRGDVFGIYGNRYAGKSNLFQMIMGKLTPTSGILHCPITEHASENVIASISKERALVDELTVWENFMILWNRRHFLPWVSASRSKAMLSLILKRYQIEIAPESRVDSLTPLQCMIVEILASKYRSAQLVLLDISGIEGTASEFEVLKRLMAQLTQEKMSFVVFSHQIARLHALSDRIAILHKGRIIDIFESGSTSPEELNAVIYRLYRNAASRTRKKAGCAERILEVADLEVGLQNPVSFYLNAGELTALFCPQADLYSALSRALDPASNTHSCIHKTEKVHKISFLDALRLGWVIREMSPLENLCLGLHDRNGKLLSGSANMLKCIERDFNEWYGDDRLLRDKDCRHLYQWECVAINLFRLKLFRPDVIFCNDIRTYNDILTYHMVMNVFSAMVESGTAVCLVTNTMNADEMIDRYVMLGDQ